MAHQSPQLDTTGDALRLLADRRCRSVISHFQHSSETACSVRELADEISNPDRGGADDLTVELHHSVLPQLDESGVVDFDARSATVRYHGHCDVEQLMGCISSL